MPDNAAAIANIRSFNRFYTHILGLLNQHILDSDFSLTEARVLLEISKGQPCQANLLADRLRLDRSFLSRILKRLEGKGVVLRTPDPADSRASHIRITPEGKQVLAELDGRSEEQIGAMVEALSPAELAEVQQAMRLIRDRFTGALSPAVIRGYREGDGDYMIRRHAEMYKAEYGLNESFATMVDGLVTRFVEKLNPARECVLIPELSGRPMGCIALADAGDGVAQLRFFLLEKEARGMGLGYRLAGAAVDFARKVGYRHIFLETISALTAARTIYSRLGFSITHTHLQSDWGPEVLDERWEMDL
jgi:DNA-binding MarR family transcriptional regulator/RimJ/RimL family protein N-acetyltransferase